MTVEFAQPITGRNNRH